MARRVGRLLDVLEIRPEVVVGHSAGAAIALRMQLDGRLGPARLVSLNGALQPFPGVSGHIFPAMAKLLFLNPLAIELFALRARQPGAIARLIESTGSKIDPAGLDHYRRLLSTSGHIAGALGMMANWNLNPLVADLPKLSVPLTLVAAQNDHAVPPRVAHAVKALLPRSQLMLVPDLGHLAHEEAPGRTAEIVHHAALQA
jgi:magnesium chelatase accessory protein